MKKKIGVMIIGILVIAIIVAYIMMFTDFGQSVRTDLYETYGKEKEIVIIEKPKNIKVTYHYGMSDIGFEMNVTDEEIINQLVDSISNKELNNETKAGIMLYIRGKYEVNFGNDITIKFDGYDNGYIKLSNKEKEFITQINSEGLKKIEDIINVKLAENAKVFNTKKITVTNAENKSVDITRKTAIEYILNECRYVGTKETNSNEVQEELRYKIDFNNGIEILQYEGIEQGKLTKDGTKYEVYGLEALDRILEFVFYDSERKDKMFSTDKIIIESLSQSIEITDKDIIEKITTPLVYSDLQERDYISKRDITEEYNNAIKVKINDYELLVSDKRGAFTMGDRYIIYPDKTRKMYFLLEDIEDYINELLYE